MILEKKVNSEPLVLEVYERLDHAHSVDDAIILDYAMREKGRFKVQSQQGNEIRIFLERGKTLTVGEYLKTACGKIIEIMGAQEEVVEARCSDWLSFAKACYHLGNRHVKIQIDECCLRIKPDYVLEEILQQLGLTLTKSNAIFIPESGAYTGGHQHHH